MVMRLLIVDYPISQKSHAISRKRMEQRRQEMISEIHMLLRPERHLTHTRLIDDFIAIGDQIYLRFQLELNPQRPLHFDKDNLPNEEYLFQERELLTREAMSLQQRINRIAVILNSNPDAVCPTLNDADDSDPLMQLAKKYSGKSIRPRFHFDEVVLNFPEIPLYTFGQLEIIEARVVEILEGEWLYLSWNVESRKKKNKKFKAKYSFSKDNADGHGSLLLAYAKLHRIPVQMSIRPVYSVGIETPCHFEVIDIEGKEILCEDVRNFLQRFPGLA